MRYFVIRHFLSDLEQLTKKPANKYHSVRKDICEEFTPMQTPDEISNKGKTIYYLEHENMHWVIKTRIKNTAMKVGKSGGFRLIHVTIQHGERTTFLTVFPKKGKFGIDNISDEKFKELLKEYEEALENDTLIEVDIDNELSGKHQIIDTFERVFFRHTSAIFRHVARYNPQN